MHESPFNLIIRQIQRLILSQAFHQISDFPLQRSKPGKAGRPGIKLARKAAAGALTKHHL